MFNKNSIANSLVDYLTSENRFTDTIWIFRRIIYLFLIVNTLTLLPMANQIWGNDALLIEEHASEHFYSPLLYFLSHTTGGSWHWLFLTGQIIFILLGFSGKIPRISSFMVFLITANLYYKAQIIANGGYQIILLMLFYLVFMEEEKRSGLHPVYSGPSNPFPYAGIILNNAFSNFALIAARIQLVFLYAFAGINKLQGDLWSRGEALYYTLSIEEFSHPLVKDWIVSSDIFIIAGNYFALSYQLLFPVLIWFRKLRLPLLLAGTFLHLCIAFIMGLMDFGFAMIACYFVFSSAELTARLKAGIRKISRKGD